MRMKNIHFYIHKIYLKKIVKFSNNYSITLNF